MAPGTVAGTLLAGPAWASTVAQPSITVQASWPQFRDGPLHSGDNTTENLLSVANVAGMVLHWDHTTGDNVYSSPAVANGTVYVGSNDHNVYALNAATGAADWTHATGGSVSSSPAVAGGTLYVGSDDGNVYALNAATGAADWTHATGGGVSSSPAVASGTLYVGSDDGNVYALNATTGKKKWAYSTGSSGVSSSPAVASGTVYVGSDDGNVYALNATTGAADWSYTTGGAVESSPAVAGGVVYVGSDDGNVYALNAATGAADWSYTTGGAVESSPAVAGGTLYIGSLDHNVYAFGLPGAASPSITASPSASQSAVGTTTTDTATLSGGSSPTGTIEFKLFGPGATGCTGTPVDDETVTITGDGSYTTPAGYTPATTGSYEWTASYSGDASNNPAVIACGDQPVTITTASPALANTPDPGSTIAGAVVTLKDTATLSGGYNPTGTVNFELTSPTGTVLDNETVTVSGDGSYTTPTGYTFQPLTAGAYQWTASYSGDSNNNSLSDGATVSVDIPCGCTR